MDKIEVTKLDAGRRQLRTAIRLWFAEDDPVSIYSLAYAAHEVIHALHKKRGGVHGLVFDSSAMTEAVQVKVKRGIKTWGNFFKHADNDPDKLITFPLEVTELLMLASITALHTLTNEVGTEEAALHFWSVVHHPKENWKIDDPDRDALATFKAHSTSKPEFWSFMRANWGTKIKWLGGFGKLPGY